jgi:hypothetical protein
VELAGDDCAASRIQALRAAMAIAPLRQSGSIRRTGASNFANFPITLQSSAQSLDWYPPEARFNLGIKAVIPH